MDRARWRELKTQAVRMMCALLAMSALSAQGAEPSYNSRVTSAATQIMSPTVVASWYARQQPDGSNRLELVILWRGTPAWWRQPGCIGSCGNVDYTVQYGSVHLTVRYDPAKQSVTVNGRDIALRGDNVLYVDNVDAPAGPRFLRTFHVDPRMPGTVGQIGILLGKSREIRDYMQCGARTGNQNLDAELAPMCLTNLGRQ